MPFEQGVHVPCYQGIALGDALGLSWRCVGRQPWLLHGPFLTHHVLWIQLADVSASINQNRQKRLPRQSCVDGWQHSRPSMNKLLDEDV